MLVLVLLKFFHPFLLQRAVVPAKLSLSLEVKLAFEKANNSEEGKRFIREIFFLSLEHFQVDISHNQDLFLKLNG